MIDPEHIHLEPIPMRKRHMQQVSASQYRIINIKGEQKSVEANTAYEAFRLAGMADAIKIERLSSIKAFIVDKAQFADEASAENVSPKMPEGGEHYEHIHLLKGSIISADDMDKLMRSLSEQAAKATAMSSAPVQTSAVPASGTEVHGDGFDEIIPSTNNQQHIKPADKPAVQEPPKAESSATASPSQDIPVVPEKSLSPEEVESLLNTNKS